MKLKRLRTGEAIDRKAFHQLLREWLAATRTDAETDPMIAPVGEENGPVGHTPWLYVRDEAGQLYYVHADLRRSSVVKYMELVDRFGDALEWNVVPNLRGNENAVVYGPDKERITSFYMYFLKRKGRKH